MLNFPKKADREVNEKLLVIRFGIDAKSDEFVGAGWSHPEEFSRWMIGPETELMLPALPDIDDLGFHIWLAPAIYGTAVPRQRLRVSLNDFVLYSGEITGPTKLDIDVPRELITRDNRNLVKFFHPDAAPPSMMGSGSDSRPLAFCVEEFVVWSRGMPLSESAEESATPNDAGVVADECVLPDHAGDSYISVLRRMHETLRPKTYLEIGTNTGDSLALSRSASIAIDPQFILNQNVMTGKPACHMFQMPSDEFFAQFRPQEILGGPIDLAFLDGMHLFEFLLRDFINTELHCRSNSVICLHDCIPSDAYITSRDEADKARHHSPHPDWWTGDVWKVAAVLQKYRADLHIYAVDAPPTGLILITSLDPDSTTLSRGYFDIVREFRDLNLADYGIRRYVESLNVMSTARLATPGDVWRYFWI